MTNQKLFNLFSLNKISSLSLLIIVLLFSACEEDTTDPGPGLDPTISLVSGPNYVSSDVTATPGDTLTFRVRVDVGDHQLNAITILEDGSTLPATQQRIIYPHISENASDANNPQAILGLDKDGLDWDIRVIMPTIDGNVNYTFRVADTQNNSDEISVNVQLAATPPTLSIFGGSSTQAAPGGLFTVVIDVNPGSSQLEKLTIKEEGNNVAADRLRYNSALSTAQFADNPLTLLGSLKDGIDNDTIYIRAGMDDGVSTYTIIIEDEVGEEISFDLTVLIGTPIDESYMAILVANADGDTSQLGGLDLDLGVAVKSRSMDAEIVDMGIDTDKVAAENWIQKIKPVNGTILRVLEGTALENFDYDAIITKEAIKSLYEEATEVSESDIVAVDDVFLVFKEDDYFLMVVRNVVVTPTDNTDYYEFDVKQALNF